MANKSYAIAILLMRICMLAAQLAMQPSATAVETMPTARAQQLALTDLLISNARLGDRPVSEVPHRLQVACCEKRRPALACVGKWLLAPNKAPAPPDAKIRSVSPEH